MKRKPQPATVIACVALFFSLGGAGFAASRYLITSPSQIKPSVRDALATPGIDWNREHTRDSELTWLYPGAPPQDVSVSCDPGSHALTGGFIGDGAITTASYLNGDYVSWDVQAHVDPASTTPGWIKAWVLCLG